MWLSKPTQSVYRVRPPTTPHPLDPLPPSRGAATGDRRSRGLPAGMPRLATGGAAATPPGGKGTRPPSLRWEFVLQAAAAASGGWEAAETGELAGAAGGPRGIEGGKLLLRGLAIRRLRELVDQPLVGLDRFLIAVELLERDRQLVEGHVLGQRRIRLVERLPQLLRHLLSLALAAVELQQIDARLDGQHVVAVLLGEV